MKVYNDGWILNCYRSYEDSFWISDEFRFFVGLFFKFNNRYGWYKKYIKVYIIICFVIIYV